MKIFTSELASVKSQISLFPQGQQHLLLPTKGRVCASPSFEYTYLEL